MSKFELDEIPRIVIELMDYDSEHSLLTLDELFRQTRQVSFVEFLEKVNSTKRFNNLNHLMELKEVFSGGTASTIYHESINIPYGHALLVLVEGLDNFNDYSFHLHPNPGIRLLVAFNTRSESILDLLSYDPCALVRAEVVKNLNSSEKTLAMLRGEHHHQVDPFEYVRHFLSGLGNVDTESLNVDTESLGDLVHNKDLGNCTCLKQGDNQEFKEFFESENLKIPAIATFRGMNISNFGDWNWATQPYPHRNQDYFLESVDYLKNPIPDQYSLNHAGHGVNSYSLNFRCAIGNIALLAQVAWGGAYMDKKKQSDRWDKIQKVLSRIFSTNTSTYSNEIKKREFLIVYSDFRLDAPRLWIQSRQAWLKLDEIQDGFDEDKQWDQIINYLEKNNDFNDQTKHFQYSNQQKKGTVDNLLIGDFYRSINPSIHPEFPYGKDNAQYAIETEDDYEDVLIEGFLKVLRGFKFLNEISEWIILGKESGRLYQFMSDRSTQESFNVSDQSDILFEHFAQILVNDAAIVTKLVHRFKPLAHCDLMGLYAEVVGYLQKYFMANQLWSEFEHQIRDSLIWLAMLEPKIEYALYKAWILDLNDPANGRSNRFYRDIFHKIEEKSLINSTENGALVERIRIGSVAVSIVATDDNVEFLVSIPEEERPKYFWDDSYFHGQIYKNDNAFPEYREHWLDLMLPEVGSSLRLGRRSYKTFEDAVEIERAWVEATGNDFN